MVNDMFTRSGKKFKARRRKDGTFKDIQPVRKSPKPANKKKQRNNKTVRVRPHFRTTASGKRVKVRGFTRRK